MDNNETFALAFGSRRERISLVRQLVRVVVAKKDVQSVAAKLNQCLAHHPRIFGVRCLKKTHYLGNHEGWMHCGSGSCVHGWEGGR